MVTYGGKGLCLHNSWSENELGGGSAESLFDVMLYYLKSMKKQSEEDAHARLPSLINISLVRLSICHIVPGQNVHRAHIGFTGAVLHRWPSVEVLSITSLLYTWNRCRAEDSSSHHFVCAQKAVLLIIANATTQNHLEAYTLYQDAQYPFKYSPQHFTLPQNAISSTCCQYWANWFSGQDGELRRKCVSNSPVSIRWRPINLHFHGIAPVLKVLNV